MRISPLACIKFPYNKLQPVIAGRKETYLLEHKKKKITAKHKIAKLGAEMKPHSALGAKNTMLVNQLISGS